VDMSGIYSKPSSTPCIEKDEKKTPRTKAERLLTVSGARSGRRLRHLGGNATRVPGRFGRTHLAASQVTHPVHIGAFRMPQDPFRTGIPSARSNDLK